MNRLPYYKAYPRDFVEDTIGWPFEVKCAYRVVLDLIYIQGGRLPDDPRYISGHLGCSLRKWKSIRADLIERNKLHVSGEFLTNNRADKELETLAKLQDKQRENAATPRKNNNLEKPRHRQPEPEPEPDIKEDTSVSKKRPAKRSVSLPDDWVPSDKNIEDAFARNFTEKDIQDEADRFRDYHLAKGSTYKDWNAAWRTWLGNARRYRESGRVARLPLPGGGAGGNSIAAVVARRHSRD